MGATRQRGSRAAREASIAPAVQLHAVDGILESTLMLETGQEVAWVYKSKANVTTGVSAVHRVFGGGKTYCSAAIPDASRRLPPLKSLNACSTCERLHNRGLEREAADAKRLGMSA